MRRFLLAAIACGALGVAGCLSDRTFEPIADHGDSTLVVHLWEELSPSVRTLRLDVQTTYTFPCYNYSLDYRKGTTPTGFGIVFTGTSIGEICLTAPGPARARIPLGSPVPGTYVINITVRGKTDRFDLVVAPDRYEVTPSRGTSVVFAEPILRRIPSHTIWGWVGYDQAGKAPLVQRYLDTLQTAGATPLDLAPGWYGYFRVGSGGDIDTGENGSYFTRDYVYRFDGDASIFPGLMRPFWPDLYISLDNDRGDSFNNWVVPVP